MTPPAGLPERLAWQWQEADEPVLNVGCESDPAGFGALASTVNVDIDHWEGVKNFRQADARELPFADGSFDTVLLCECLDHMDEPERAIKEALRVAHHAVVITLPADDGAVEDPEHWRAHIEHLKGLGLLQVASGDLKLRHGHCKHWQRPEVMALVGKAVGDSSTMQLWYSVAGTNPPEHRVVLCKNERKP